MKPIMMFIVIILCLLAHISIGSQPVGVYTVGVMEKREALTDAEIHGYFELEKYAKDSPSGALGNLKRVLHGMKLFFDKETTVYRRERAFVQSSDVWVESVGISRTEYEQAQQGTDPLDHFPTDRDVFIYAPDMKIQLIKHKSSGFKGISCGVFDDSYSDDPFWLFAAEGYVDHVYDKYRMESMQVSSNRIVVGKSNEYAIAELVISLSEGAMQNTKYFINKVLVREVIFGEYITVDGLQLPKSTRIVHYLGTGSVSKDKAIREVTYTLIPSSTQMGDVAESGYPFPYDEDIYCVDYRKGSARDVFLTTNGVVRELRPVQPVDPSASPTSGKGNTHYDNVYSNEPTREESSGIVPPDIKSTDDGNRINQHAQLPTDQLLKRAYASELVGTGSARAVFQYTRARHPYNMSELLQKSAISRGRNPLAGAEQDQAVRLLSTLTRHKPYQKEELKTSLLYYGYSQYEQTASSRTQLKSIYSDQAGEAIPSNWGSLDMLQPISVSLFKDQVEWVKHSKREPWRQYPRSAMGLTPHFEWFGRSPYIETSYLQQTHSWTVTTNLSENMITYIFRDDQRGIKGREVGVVVSLTEPGQISKTWVGAFNAPQEERVYSDYMALEDGTYYPRKTIIRKWLQIEEKSILVEEETYEVLGEMIEFSPPDPDAPWFDWHYWDDRYKVNEQNSKEDSIRED